MHENTSKINKCKKAPVCVAFICPYIEADPTHQNTRPTYNKKMSVMGVTESQITNTKWQVEAYFHEEVKTNLYIFIGTLKGHLLRSHWAADPVASRTD